MLLRMRKILICVFAVILAATAIALGALLITPEGTAYASSQYGVGITNKWGTVSGYVYDTFAEAWTRATDITEGDKATVQLCMDTEIDSTLTVGAGKNITLDLNGHKLSLASGVSGTVIKIDGGSFTLDDSEIDKAESERTSNTVFNWVSNQDEIIKGGVITGSNNTSNGGGVSLDNYGKFTMKAGTIAGNNGYRGGVSAVNGSEFTMEGGAIYGNNSSSGVCVYISGLNNKQSVFTMSDGTIKGNNGGVYIYGGKLTMTGGAITENTLGDYCTGVYFNAGEFEVSGDPIIKGNKLNNAENNVSFRYSKLTVIDALTEGAEIYINNTGEVFTGYTFNGSDKPSKYFIPDEAANNCVYVSDNTTGTVVIGTHSYSGNTCSQCGEHKPVEVKIGDVTQAYMTIEEAWTAATDGDSPAQITLFADVTTENALSVYSRNSITLDLNGHSLTGTINDDSLISVKGIFTLEDNNKTDRIGRKYDIDDASGRYIFAQDGTRTLYGGLINNSGKSISGGAVEVYGGTFTMNGGTIAGCAADSSGGGVYVYDNSDLPQRAYGRFIMNDGNIVGNVALTGGGGVSVKSGLNGNSEEDKYAFRMIGGVIKENIAIGIHGGGVRIYSGAFHMSANAVISANTAYAYGGGVYVGLNCAFTMTGGVISSNTANEANDACGGGVYVDNRGTFTMTDGTVGGDGGANVSDYGGGVRVNLGAKFTMSGGEISYNTASNDGGGLCVYSAQEVTLSGGQISHNSAHNGGGIYFEGIVKDDISGVDPTENYVLDGVTVSQNLATGTYATGAGVYIDGSTVTMSDGSISGNNASYGQSAGGGVYVRNTRSNDSSTVISSSKFTITGGSISDNYARTFAGGVYVDSEFEMSDSAVISGNSTDSDGGGVYVSSDGKFIMNSGTISGNAASGNYGTGGGVSVSGVFRMKGGTIGGKSPEDANSATEQGGGVYVTGDFGVSGEVWIYGNSNGNVYVSPDTSLIKVPNALTGNAIIGITVSDDSGRAFTSGYGSHNTDNNNDFVKPYTYFRSDKGYCVRLDGAEVAISSSHDYESEFTVDKEATCTEDGSKSRHCKYCDSKTEVTTIAAAHSYVDGVCTVCGVRTLFWGVDSSGKLTITANESDLDGITDTAKKGEFASDYKFRNSSLWYSQRNNITSAEVLGDKIVAPVYTSRWFKDLAKLETVDLTGLNTENVTDMYGMFYGCSALTALDLSGFNTANVEEMGSMFEGCESLTSLDLSAFDIAKVKYMGYMFMDCKNLTSITFGDGFNTSSVQNMNRTFYGCSALTSLDLSGFDTSKVEDMDSIFRFCSKLASITFGNRFDTSSVKDMRNMFDGCKRLTSLGLSGFNTASVQNMNSMFYNCERLKSIVFGDGFDTSGVSDMGYMFYGCTVLTAIDLSGFNTSAVTNFKCMFGFCQALKSVDLSTFDVSAITSEDNASAVFAACNALKTIKTPASVGTYALSLPAKFWNGEHNIEEIASADANKTIYYHKDHSGGTATCTNQAVCSVCGNSYGEIDSTAHTFATEWSKDASGHWHAATCAHTTQKGSFAEHTPSDWIVDTPAQTGVEGSKHKECTVCGYVMQTESIPAIDPGHEHTFSTEWTKDETGHWHAATCEHISQKSGFAAHTAGEWIVDTPAQIGVEGSKHKECTVCGYVMQTESIPAIDLGHEHTFSTEWTKDETGHWHAATCGHISQKGGFAAHTAGEWIVDTPAQIGVEGSRHKECTVCGYTVQTEIIPALKTELVKPDVNGGENNVVITAPNGFAPNTELVVTEISQDNYSQYEEIAQTVNGEVGFVYDLTLKTDGVTVQPDGMLTVKLLIPENMKGKSFRLFHMYGGEATEMQFTVEGNYAVVSADKLDEFVFVGENVTDSSPNTVWIVMITILAVVVALEIGYIVYAEVRKKKASEVRK